MAENWNVETVADSKPQAPPDKPSTPAPAAIPSVLSNDYTLGKIMSMARENRGLSREQAAKSSNIPGYYLTMIESDDYSSIADQLYLLPFLRRYASFVGLEPEEVASRFIRDVQRADMNPGRVSEPMVMIADRKPFPWEGVLLIGGGAIVSIVVIWLVYRHFFAVKPVVARPSAPVAVQPQVAPAPEPRPSAVASESAAKESVSAKPALPLPAPAVAPPPEDRVSTQESVAKPAPRASNASPTKPSAGHTKASARPH